MFYLHQKFTLALEKAINMEMEIFSKIVSDYPDLVYGYSGKEDGNMSFKWGSASAVLQARNRFVSKLIKPEQSVELYEMSPVHKSHVVVLPSDEVDLKSGRFLVDECDGLVILTDLNKTKLLSCIFADCLPVHLFDPKKKICGLAHAGWMGLLNGVIDSIVEKMQVCGSGVEDLVGYIGPSIHPCCFKVYGEVYDKFKRSQFSKGCFKKGENGKFPFNLQQFCVNQLIYFGVSKDSIEVSPDCTCCNEYYFSYKSEGKNREGSNIAIFGYRRKI